MSRNSSQDLIHELRSRFPIFDRVAGRFGEDSPEERIPWFFALLLAAAMNGEPGACCFVLDKTQGTTAVAAVLLALARLQEDFPQLAESYARTALDKGQRVRVKPSDFVYEYEGIWDEHPGQFRLKVLDKTDRRSFLTSEVLRLEPTTRKRPKGTLASKLGVFDRSSLDDLLDITTYGNISMIRNVVLLYMAQARFAKIAGAVSLAPAHSSHFDPLSAFLSWGTLGHGGEMMAGDAYQVIGEPLIAVTRVPQDLANTAASAREESKIVLVDGARGIARDLQAFDDIAERQRVVILASPDETEEIGFLRDRDCPIWYMSAGEILMGEDLPSERSRSSLVGRTIRASVVRGQCRVTAVDCNSHELEAVASTLEGVANAINGTEERSEVDDILARLYGILLEISECCLGVGEETRLNLREAQDSLDRNQRWLDPDIVTQLQNTIDQLESALASGGSYGEKSEALLTLLTESDGRWAVAARSPRTSEWLRDGLSNLGADMPVIPVRSIPPEDEYDGIIVPAWPNGSRFTRLKNLAVTQDIRVLAYPFERRWLLSHQTRERSNAESNRMEVEERAAILGVESSLLPAMKMQQPHMPSDGASSDPPMLKFEDRVSRRRSKRPSPAGIGDDTRRARLVEFYGGRYALLTEWSQLHVLNELIDSRPGASGRLRTVAASDLSHDDFVLFRAGGDKEFIRLLAEDELGTEEYGRIRSIAELWKSSLRRLGGAPATVQRRLEKHGLCRTLPTIAGWMGNPDRIGPGYDSDIEAIARAANDAELLAGLDTVREAISRIRGAHIVAGSRLTQLILGEVRGRLGQLDDQPILLDLGYGQAWIVQVESVDTHQQEYPADQTNRLLGSDDSVF